MNFTLQSTLDEVDAALDALATDSNVSDDALAAAYADIARRVSEAHGDLTRTLTDDQRRALFAAFERVFNVRYGNVRKAFTRIALGKAADAPVSWSANGYGALTRREASKVLDALGSLERALAGPG